MKITNPLDTKPASCHSYGVTLAIAEQKKLRRSTLPFEVRKIGDRRYRFTASDETPDRWNSIIRQNWILEAFRRNPVILWGHDHAIPAIGNAIEVGVELVTGRRRLWIEVEFVDSETYAFAGLIEKLIDKGVIRSVSVGFMPIRTRRVTEEKELAELGLKPGWPPAEVIEESELWEVSIVNIPANPNALIDELAMAAPAVRSIVETRRGDCDSIMREIALMLRPDIAGGEEESSTRLIPERLPVQLRRPLQRAERASEVQSVIFSKEAGGWSVEKAREWLEAHDRRSDKVDETENSWRFRQFDPERCKGDFVTLTEKMPEGISMVACDTGGSSRMKHDLAPVIDALRDVSGIINDAVEMLEDMENEQENLAEESGPSGAKATPQAIRTPKQEILDDIRRLLVPAGT